MKKQLTNIILAGAAPDTGNHGVTALALSLLSALDKRGLQQATVLDNGGSMRLGELLSLHYRTLALKPGKRFYQPNNMHQVRIRQMFGLPSPILSTIKNADAVLDVSGGDSFTDMYGPARFEQITVPKLMAIDAGVPLILLPQTYGPYQFTKTRRIARKILNAAHLAYARDEDSYKNLQTLLGDDFDPQQHRLGVDLAFGLPCVGGDNTPDDLPVGINVSGLLWHDAAAAAEQFSLKADYKQSLIQFALKILEDTNKDILLVPHVRPSGGSECDLVASRAFKLAIPSEYRNRIQIEKNANSPELLKGTISNTCWFTGARMHATIAALSTGVPVCNMAYSMKARGVFASCGQQEQVFDLRKNSTDQMVSALFASFNQRQKTKAELAFSLSNAKRVWVQQMNDISYALDEPKEKLEVVYA
ncbi:polysaccharide pyruvyl transferase family protein [Kordiimonas laminariae]|uniref:polysaccharide pyruvyl transferase family protein n=1 Tax=Kordiimonas laminariae TaxID=2917717 RepID=UPI001FF5DE0C|nr:polysaccharide pyruvyl transferase family protein [Kordiimonas laminariae]MCK0067843.1 polysaccharide pyruvyl transferase family protein [Kordiimonas laminariae]